MAGNTYVDRVGGYDIYCLADGTLTSPDVDQGSTVLVTDCHGHNDNTSEDTTRFGRTRAPCDNSLMEVVRGSSSCVTNNSWSGHSYYYHAQTGKRIRAVCADSMGCYLDCAFGRRFSPAVTLRCVLPGALRAGDGARGAGWLLAARSPGLSRQNLPPALCPAPPLTVILPGLGPCLRRSATRMVKPVRRAGASDCLLSSRHASTTMPVAT